MIGGGAVNISGTDLNVISVEGSALLQGASFTANVTQDVTVQGGGASAEIMNTGPAAFNINAGGNVSVTGGSGEEAYARIFGAPNVNLTVGGNINLTSGTGGAGAFARIQAGSPTTIIISFTNPTGQILVNSIPFDPAATGSDSSGLFVGPLLGTPNRATSANFQVSFAAPASSTQATDQAVQAVSNTTIQATTTASTTATQSTGTPPADTSGTAATGTSDAASSDPEKKDEKAQDQKQAAAGQTSASKTSKPKPQLCN